MRGIILAGGSGSRLKPLTDVINKHLLPVYNQPMIYWPIQTFVHNGIKDIFLVCGGNNPGEFLRLLGNGEQFGLKHISYAYQKDAKGIADALKLAEEWSNNEPVCVLLGDNIILESITEPIQEFEKNPDGAKIFLTEVEHPEWYGVVSTDSKGNVIKITEKPKKPKSHLIAIGLYVYDKEIWNYINTLTPSARQELEITDLNNVYLSKNKLQSYKLKGWWGDCGESIDTYLDNCNKVRELVNV
jgi:glucose-1-phosphate thymidylyltransferase